MAETLKRQREEPQLDDCENDSKHHKSYNHILSLLEAEEDEPTQDLSSLITTLQQELSSDSAFDPLPCPNTETYHESPSAASSTTALEGYGSSSSGSSSPSSSSSGFLKEDEQEDDSERVMRHLLEASDDELGLPNRDEVEVGFNAEDGFNGGNGFSLCDELWELEDEAANYYTLVQSELFM